MLRELKITNLALIEELVISFGEGLVVLTGETGAGKSIILQAIHLLSGGRAGANWVRTGADNATVEAFFEISPEHVELLDQVRDMGFDAGDDLIIRRVLSQNNKSRYFINGSMATAKAVGELTENLLSVASQHDHQQLLNPKNHLDFIDSVGNLWPERNRVGEIYQRWLELKKEHENLLAQEKDKEQRRDFLTFQCKEIEEANIRVGEDDELAAEKDRLKASGDLLRLGQESYDLLTNSIVDNLAVVRKNIEQMVSFDDALSRLYDGVAEQSFQLEDSVMQLLNYVEDIPTDPALLEEVTARIDLLQKLKRKYGPTLADVVAFGEKARDELNTLDAMDERLDEIKAELSATEKELLAEAEKLSQKRQEAAARFSQKIKEELHSLQFVQAEFEVKFETSSQPIESMTRKGLDRPEFLFSANPGEPLKSLVSVASGGELSRLMLALKCILASKDMVETVIFDEIDAGISGKTAEAVARKIKELAGHHQVLCITHLPQIASYADEHFQVAKSVSGQRTRTNISRLSEEKSRIEEVARMLDGDSVTSRTMEYAQELISRNQ